MANELGRHGKALGAMFEATPPEPDAVSLCGDWLRLFAARSAATSNRTYPMKHSAERFGDFSAGHVYIGEPSLILALVREGYELEVEPSANPKYPLVRTNASLNRWRECERELDNMVDAFQKNWPRPEYADAQRTVWGAYFGATSAQILGNCKGE